MANLLVSFILSIYLYLQIAQSSKLKIVGGTPVKADDYPFIAHLQIVKEYVPSDGYMYIGDCGGSLLRKEKPAVILTAAHCIHDIEHPSRQVTYDESYVLLHADTSDDPNGIKKQVSSIKVHPDYAWNHHPDVALVFINEDLTPYTQLSTVFFNENFDWKPSECCSTGDDLTVIGYGKDCDGCPATPTLEAVDVDYLSRSECSNGKENRYNHISDDQICAYTVNADSCQGDSGGPLFKRGTREQVGIVSTGYGCAEYPGIYTNIGNKDIYNWINNEMKSEN
eukprot:CAMPEP_0201565574 /NCGR_PEP_ID=MMETSP0190_2-20130828/4782_1 /ASSEMBLY_ACC=CAM_ASM_000263 /TAXON_ID=37353 /ORGANISM="Rosalina sp." /LENGTH=280 /DNA_ID=CAMNT_0047983225 /DNA_START=1 /DNA_END=843 /DNA_ORIENTATION=-